MRQVRYKICFRLSAEDAARWDTFPRSGSLEMVCYSLTEAEEEIQRIKDDPERYDYPKWMGFAWMWAEELEENERSMG